MDNTPALPPLVFNRSFIQTFLLEKPPCFALGLLEEDGKQCGVFALSLASPLPEAVSSQGFNFGHNLIGTHQFEVIHLSFEVYGFQTYHALINPNNPTVQVVLRQMIETGDYFFLALNQDHDGAILFRSDLGSNTMSYLTENYERLQQSTTTDEQYLQANIAFLKDLHPDGPLLRWVCGDTLDYLDLTTDRLEMRQT